MQVSYVSAEKLQKRTGASWSDVKEALIKAEGDELEALIWLEEMDGNDYSEGYRPKKTEAQEEAQPEKKKPSIEEKYSTRVDDVMDQLFEDEKASVKEDVHKEKDQEPGCEKKAKGPKSGKRRHRKDYSHVGKKMETVGQKIVAAVKKLHAIRLVVHNKAERVMAIPMTFALLALLFMPWFTIICAVAGVILGLSYGVERKPVVEYKHRETEKEDQDEY